MIARCAVLLTVCGLAGCGSSKSGSAPLDQPAKTTATSVRGSTVPVGPASATPLSPPTQQRARPACRQLRLEVAKYRYGAGLDTLVKQATAFRAARRRLADRLETLHVSATDAALLARYTSRLRYDNRWLTAAIKRAKAGDTPGAYRQLGIWQLHLDVETKLTSQLHVRSC